MGTAPAPRGTFPWMVSLFVLISNTGEALFMCAGTLLTPNLVVTAAHCFTNNDREETWFVLLEGLFTQSDRACRTAQFSQIRSTPFMYVV
jgi:V8-like Glu-specific endopeptidase